jgi:hypothetical protein
MTIPRTIRHVLSAPRVSQVERFAEVADQLSDSLYWRLAGHIWKHTAPYFYAALWHQLLTSPPDPAAQTSPESQQIALWGGRQQEVICVPRFKSHSPFPAWVTAGAYRLPCAGA